MLIAHCHGIAGGIVGGIGETVIIDSCYNSGTITGNSTSCQSTGGIIGHVGSSTSSGNSVIKNCYNIGTISKSNNIGGIIAGYHQEGKISLSSNYWLSGCGATYGIAQKNSNSGAGSITASNFKANATILGDAFTDDIQNEDGTWKYNNGYPILKWQLEEK